MSIRILMILGLALPAYDMLIDPYIPEDILQWSESSAEHESRVRVDGILLEAGEACAAIHARQNGSPIIRSRVARFDFLVEDDRIVVDMVAKPKSIIGAGPNSTYETETWTASCTFSPIEGGFHYELLSINDLEWLEPNH